MNDQANIYQTPAANLLNDEIPTQFFSAPFSPSMYRWAAICVALSISLSITREFVSAFALDVGSDMLFFASESVGILAIGLWIYVLLVLKRLLHYRLSHQRSHWLIYAMMITATISIIPLLFDPMLENEEGWPWIAYYFILGVDGLLSMVLGKHLLSIQIPFPNLKLYAWMSIIGGLFLLTHILLVLSLPFSIVAYIVLIKMFLKAAHELIDANSSTSS